MSLIEAIIQVLLESGRPMRAEDISEVILAKGLWQSEGKTPSATVGARLYTSIKKMKELSPFYLAAPCTFGLRIGYSNKTTDRLEALPGSYFQKDIPPSITRCTFLDAAEKVLREKGKGEPMHYCVITEEALKAGFLVSKGKTPSATMSSQLHTDIKQKESEKKDPRFSYHEKGFFGLAEWEKHDLSFEIEKHNKGTHEALHTQLFNIDWGAFESLIARLLEELGFENIELTNRSKDGGIDVRGTLVVAGVIRIRMAIQVKRWKSNILSPVVQQVRGSLGTHEQGLIITTSDFSSGAREEAARADATPVALMNGKQLVGLLIDNEIGVLRKNHNLFDLNISSL